MGTRGTITIIFNGKSFRMYNHWDSYPAGLGAQLLAELREMLKSMTLEQIQAQIDKMVILRPVTTGTTADQKTPEGAGEVKVTLAADGIHRAPTEDEIEKLAPYTDLSVSRGSTNDWYCLLRRCQGSLGRTIEAGYVVNHGDEDDEEFNYVVDFTAGRLYCREAKGYDYSLGNLPAAMTLDEDDTDE